MTDDPSVQFKGDPFFELGSNKEWNALIGNQGNEENYIDGYIEAATELVTAIINNKILSSRDTLVLPILYTGRHALELTLKFSITKLHQMGKLKDGPKLDHDIKSHWNCLHSSTIGDQTIQHLVAELEPFITSLDMIDKDGQELRYPENRSKQKSLAEYSLVNILQVRTGLDSMAEVLTKLRCRILAFRDELQTGSYTVNCSRNDLKNIASMLGNRNSWREDGFEQAKQTVMERYNLSGKKFSDAVTKILGSRGLSTIVGHETGLTYLSDENVILVMDEWNKLHPANRPQEGNLDTENSNHIQPMSNLIEAAMKPDLVELEVIKNVLGMLSLEEIADLEALFDVGRGKLFGELYDDLLEKRVQSFQNEASLENAVSHLMSKTNLFECVTYGCKIVGRPSLSEKLMKLRSTCQQHGTVYQAKSDASKQ